jgi:hypothetical protein
VNAQVRASYMQIAQENPNLYATAFSMPKLPSAGLATVFNSVD